MKFTQEYLNELPFMIDMPDGKYSVKTKYGVVELNIFSDFYKLNIAPSPKDANKYVYYGTEEELQKIVLNKRIPNYAFCKCKSFVRCTIEKEVEIKECLYDGITQEDCIEEIKSLLIRKGVDYTDTNDLTLKAEEYYGKLGDDEINNIKFNKIASGTFGSFNIIYGYYEALNNFIEQYAYLRNIFWINKLDENILQGTCVREYIDGALFDEYTFGGLVPSMWPYLKLYPDVNESELQIFKHRLQNSYEVPLEKQLIIVARSLWYRCEYRSAVMESSAALEIAVEKKLVEKMKLRGMNHSKRMKELNKTKIKFKERCDRVLKRYTGTSFVVDNAGLWKSIDDNRKNYRHKIVHSKISPDKKTCEAVINKFEEAIDYINSL